MSLRIAWLIAGDEAYGVRTAVNNLMLGLKDKGHQVSFIALRRGSFTDQLLARGEEVTLLSVPTIAIPTGAVRVRSLWTLVAWLRDSLRFAVRLRRQLTTSSVQVLHVVWPNHVLAAGLAAGRSRTVVWEMVNTVRDAPWSRLIYRFIARTLGIDVLANSHHTALSLNPSQKPVGWPAVMHLSTPTASPTDLPVGRTVIACIARLHSSKMQAELIKATSRVEFGGGVEVRLSGTSNDEYSSWLSEIADEEQARGGAVTTFVGRTDDSLAELARSSFVFAVRRDPEPFGLTVIEAMMAGRPVLACRTGGPAETVLDGVTGWLIDDPSLDGVILGLNRAFADRERWTEMGSNGHSRAMNLFTPDRQADRYLEILADRIPAPESATDRRTSREVETQ